MDDGAALPSPWKGGLIRFLFKKGDVLDIACYRPVCLLDTIYKILSAVLTDRLYRLCERHGLLDPSQEGFRRLHSTQRQVQSLHWAWEEAAEQKKSLYVAYLDFENAFN
ncbi:MAG: reverse transcriptase domain-containing protein, partial [bacterium]